MSREVRVARGAAGALMATVLAAVSHAAAGGEITAVALLATALFALPLCVALAGRMGSLWRLTLAVSISQFVYHWSFAGLGVATGPVTSGGIAEGPHAAHLAQMQQFVPALVDAGSAGAVMWASHGVSAILTIALMYRGERAFIAVRSRLRKALLSKFVCGVAPQFTPHVTVPFEGPVTLRDLIRSRLACITRGPPVRLHTPRS